MHAHVPINVASRHTLKAVKAWHVHVHGMRL